jgi:hypothetical protein
MRRRCVTLLAVLAPLLVSSSTLAADRVSECVAAHAEGQELRNQSRLLAAKAKFLECKSESCPALVRDECVAFAQSVEQALPTVVFAALDEQGKFTADPTLTIDGAPLRVPFDGRAVTLDPGPHRVVFQRPGGRARTVDLVLAESEHDRRVVADFRPPPDQASVGSEPSGARTAVLVSAGVAALALGSFTYFALSGHAIQSDLERCKPNCENRNDLDRMRARYLGADLSLGAALVSLGVGAIIWAKNPAIFSHGGARPEPTLAFGVQPSAGTRGVELSARARF